MQAVVPEDVDIRARVRPVALRARSAIRGLVTEGAARRAAHRPDGAAVPARLAQRAHRRRQHPVRAAGRGGLRCGLTGQTINIMTLGGLALAVGVLVDEATVEIENIHTHMARGLVPRAAPCWTPAARRPCRACWRCSASSRCSCRRSSWRASARQLFVPLSLAVGFAMIASYLLSSTLVPVLSAWLHAAAGAHRTTRLRPPAQARYHRVLGRLCCGVAPAGARPTCWSTGALALAAAAPRHRDLPAPVTPASSSCGCAPPPARASSAPKSSRCAALDVITARSRARSNVADHHRLHRRAAGQLSHQHHLPVDQRPARGRAAGGAQARRRPCGARR